MDVTRKIADLQNSGRHFHPVGLNPSRVTQRTRITMGLSLSKSAEPAPDVVVDRVLYWVQAACPNFNSEGEAEAKFCTKSSSLPCVHAQTLLNCLKTSKTNFNLAALYLWKYYATFEDVMKLLLCNDAGVAGLENPTQCVRAFWSSTHQLVDLLIIPSVKVSPHLI